jgi:hypothetical protein
MAIGTKDRQRIAIILAAFAGHPVYFFDTTFLLANVSSLAGWNHGRLDAAIAPRVEKQISPGDVRFAVPNGFYVAFKTENISAAWDTAQAICDDILTHFYGHGDYDRADIANFCHRSSVEEAAEELDIKPSVTRPLSSRTTKGRGSVADDLPESEIEKRLFRRTLVELFLSHFNSEAESATFLFAPCWDNRKEAITSFACEPVADAFDSPALNPAARGLPSAIAQCKLDVIALAIAARGARHLLARGDVAAVSSPVHVETLSWVKTRHAYIHVLAKIDPRYLMLFAPRITGFIAGSNSLSIAQWVLELRRYVRRSFVRLPNLDFDFSRDGILGVTGFGVDVTPSMRASTSPRAALETLASKLKRICANQSALTIVGNVVSEEEFLLLKYLGIRFIGGPVIGKPSVLPAPVGRLPLGEGTRMQANAW